MFRLPRLWNLLSSIAACALVCGVGVATMPQARAAQNPRPAPGNVPVLIGSYSAPALRGWRREAGDWTWLHVVYYRRTVGDTPLMAKVIQIQAPRGTLPEDLRREKAGLERELASGDRSRLITSRLIRYRGGPAVLVVRQVRSGGEVTHIRSLIFNDGQSQYQVTVYAHSLSRGTLQVADAGWQELTLGLRRHA